MTVYIGPTENIDKALTALKMHIKTHGILADNTPVGVQIMASGVLYVTYSLSAPRKADNTATAAEIITDFLKGQEQ